MKPLPQILWILLLLILGIIIGQNAVGWILTALVGLLIFPKYWDAREDRGDDPFTGPRIVVSVLFTIAMAFGAWGKIGGVTTFAGSEAQAAVAGTLRDPSSAEFRNIVEGATATCGEVNGKNAFGAYAGFNSFTYADGMVRIEPSEPLVKDIPSMTAYYQEVADFARVKRRCYE